jgi:5-methylcytosine-specific restriction endonuclease McrA
MAKWIEKEVRLAHYFAEGWSGAEGAADGSLTCTCCGVALKVGAHTSDPQAASLDHIQPRAVTGKARDARKENLVSVCARCNSSRQDQDMRDFARRFDAAAVFARIGERVAAKLARDTWTQALAKGRQATTRVR